MIRTERGSQETRSPTNLSAEITRIIARLKPGKWTSICPETTSSSLGRHRFLDAIEEGDSVGFSTGRASFPNEGVGILVLRFTVKETQKHENRGSSEIKGRTGNIKPGSPRETGGKKTQRGLEPVAGGTSLEAPRPPRQERDGSCLAPSLTGRASEYLACHDKFIGKEPQKVPFR